MSDEESPYAASGTSMDLRFEPDADFGPLFFITGDKNCEESAKKEFDAKQDKNREESAKKEFDAKQDKNREESAKKEFDAKQDKNREEFAKKEFDSKQYGDAMSGANEANPNFLKDGVQEENLRKEDFALGEKDFAPGDFTSSMC